jgi:multiple sugar transport system permease protein
MTNRERKEVWAALIFLSPWIIGFVVFTAGPMIASLVLSFCRWDMISPAKWVGFANYIEMAHDKLVYKSLSNTIIYSAMYIPTSIVTALALAMLLNQKLPGMRIFRTIYYLPTLTQGVATFVLWATVFESEIGLLNRILRPITHLFGYEPPSWLHDTTWSKPAIVIMGVWGVGGMMLIFLAGLQNIPEQLYEAAEIDGAGRWRQFFNVTLPMLSPVIFFNTILTTIGSLRVFDAAFVLTGGGPSKSTLFYVYYLFNRAFVHFNMGYASAMAWLLFAIVLVLTIIQVRVGQKWVHYG